MPTRSEKPIDAASPLATPTDLKFEEVESIRKAINPLIADAFALYIKTKNFHWHVAGSHFRDYHLLLDEQAESILGSIDPLAERLRQIGATTLRSISQISREQRITDDESEFVPPEQMISRLLADNRLMAEAQRAAIEVCDQNRDSPTSNLLQEILDQTEKRIWFLFEVTQGAHESQQAGEAGARQESLPRTMARAAAPHRR
jgi:starvation-inducible DNA-binding protein